MDDKQLLENARMVHQVSGDYIKRREAEFVEAEKPKLRHGDVYVRDSFIAVLRYRDGQWVATHRDNSMVTGDMEMILRHLVDFTFSHNIFDDLKAIAEPLTEFELDATYIRGRLHGKQILLTDRDETSCLSLAKVSELVSYLQRLVYTAERKKNA